MEGDEQRSEFLGRESLERDTVRLQRKESARMKPIAYLSLSSSSSLKDERIKVFKACVCV